MSVKTIDSWLAHRTRRWHTNPHLAHVGQNLADHSWGVAQIIMQLHPNPSRELIGAALMHDAGEHVVGDVPGPAKKRFPAAAAAWAAIEKVEAERLMPGWLVEALPNLSEEDRKWLSLADGLEALIWAEHYANDSRGEKAFEAQCDAVMELAVELEVSGKVRAGVRHLAMGGDA